MRTFSWLPTLRTTSTTGSDSCARRRGPAVGAGFVQLEDRTVPSFSEFVDPNPNFQNQFGHSVVPLPTGNVVITSPYDDAGGTDAGAVYLFSGSTGQLISTLRGSSTNDRVGFDGVTVLSNGNFVVRSRFWDNGGVADAGAATWVNGATGLNGVVSSANSLVGSTADDQVGTIVRALGNGNYVALNSLWDNSSAVDAGAASDLHPEVWSAPNESRG